MDKLLTYANAVWSILFLIVAVLVVATSKKSQSKDIEDQTARIDEALAKLASRYFDPSTAILVRKRDEDTGGDGPTMIQSHRIYRTPQGMYFLFVCSVGAPGYLTHLSRERVINALRSTPEILAKEFPGEVKS